VETANGKRQLWTAGLAGDHHQISTPFGKLFNISLQERKSNFSDATGAAKNVHRTTAGTIGDHCLYDR
jgi:hypothetical protein